MEIENILEHNAALFEVQYEMQRPNVFFVPNLNASSPNGFMSFLEELIIDIYSMSDMIQRVAQPPESERINEADGKPYMATYESEFYFRLLRGASTLLNINKYFFLAAILGTNTDIETIRDDIVRCAKSGTMHAEEYVKCYDKYEHLWTIDRANYLQEYLKYGRALTAEELENLEENPEFKIKEMKPTLAMFQDKVKSFFYY